MEIVLHSLLNQNSSVAEMSCYLNIINIRHGFYSREGRDSNIKKVGVLIVSLRGVHVNFRFWSHVGLSFKVSLRVAREEMQHFC